MLLILLSLGIVFELPILIFFLTLFGIVTPGFLWRNFRYAILIIAVVAAIVTPTPDAMTMLVFMMPMVALYFVGIGVSAMVVRKKRKRLEAERPRIENGKLKMEKSRATLADSGKARFAEGQRSGETMGAFGLARVLVLAVVAAVALGCKSGPSASTTAPRSNAGQPPFMSAVAGPPPRPADEAPPAEKTGGFDGKRAYEQVVKQLSYGPRPAGSPALAKLQDYLESELKSYGCAVEADSFSADTPAGRLPMKNFLVKIPGQKPGIILLGTHYDTKRLENFVGADDAGSSTGVMLEMARLLCAQKQPRKYAVWIAFFDGEEAVNREWADPDNRYGSRQMAAKLAVDGDLTKMKAFILADIVGRTDIRISSGTASPRSG